MSLNGYKNSNCYEKLMLISFAIIIFPDLKYILHVPNESSLNKFNSLLDRFHVFGHKLPDRIIVAGACASKQCATVHVLYDL